MPHGCVARIAAGPPGPSCQRRSVQSTFGPRHQAAVAVLSIRNRVSRRDACELAGELAGTVDQILTRTSAALADPCEDLLDRVRAAGGVEHGRDGLAAQRRPAHLVGHVHRPARCDERSPQAAMRITPKRSSADTRAVVTSDRWWAYSHLPVARRQICWSHLQRDFQAQAEGLAAEKEFGEIDLEVCEQLFHAFQRTEDRIELKRQIRGPAPPTETGSAHLRRQSATLQAHPAGWPGTY